MLSDQRIAELTREATVHIDAGEMLRLARIDTEVAIRTAIRETQEACALLCDDMGYANEGPFQCAAAIRKAGY